MVSEIWSVTDRILLFLTNFSPFTLSNNLKNQNFENMKKIPEDNIILHKCTLNENHMMYGA